MKEIRFADPSPARVTRRRFLLGAAAAAAAPGALHAAGPVRAEAGGRRLGRIGIQLYTLREQMERSVPETLEALAGIGYDEVEFAGYFDHSPAEIRALLGAAGLAAPAAHVPIEDIRARPGALIEAAVEIGHRYLVLPWLPEEERTLDRYRAHAALCNRFARECRDAGLGFAYHNHDFEFRSVEGRRPYDLLLDETDPDLVDFELDLYWIVKGGADPLAYFSRHPGRFPLCHVKDMAEDGSMTDAGCGTIDFAEIFAAGDQAGLRHYFVERDDAPEPLASAERSYAALSRLTF